MCITSGNVYDSIVAYTHQLGFKAISLYDQGFIRPDRGNGGYIDGRNFEKKPLKMASGDKSHKEFSEIAARLGLSSAGRRLRLHSHPVPKMPALSRATAFATSKSALLQKYRPADTMIFVNDPQIS
jgi:hypothetical protein